MNASLTNADAIAIAATWIGESSLPVSAAFIGGSVAHADDFAPYDHASDIDCYLVVEGDPPEGKIGKLTVRGVLLDVSWMPWAALEHAETDAVLASLLHFGRVVKDDRKLGPLQTKISRDFATDGMIATRLESMRAKIRAGLAVDSSHLSHPEQVMNWLFPATLATHIDLVQNCAPLTVRKRFLAARQVMPTRRYESLLRLFGFDSVTRQQAQSWLDATTQLFDATIEIAEQSDRFWATDIQADARHIAIDATQKLIDEGDHREALYWILATSSRCLNVRNDAKADSAPYVGEYRHMLNALMIETESQRQSRTGAILAWI